VSAPTRPALRYLGGKWRLAPWIVSHFPPHRTYVEPFGGAASVLLRKPRSYAEIYNDLDGDVVNLFRVLRDPAQAERLVGLVGLTPFARAEFDASYELSDDPVERARRLVVRSFMGHGSNAPNINRTTGFRANATRNGTTPAQDWCNFPPALAAVAARIQSGVEIESQPALKVIRRFDGPRTLFYVDPPYVHATRSAKTVRGALYNAYVHELSDADHVELLDCLDAAAGMVVLSGYPHPLYDGRLKTWRRVEREAFADGAAERTEVLWINPAAQAAMRGQPDMFEGAAA
jgi:DNA adenine methylase